MKIQKKCERCGSESFRLTEIEDAFGEIIKIKICKCCGSIFERN